MGTSRMQDQEQKLQNLPNFRRVDTGKNDTKEGNSKAVLYRSSRPDHLTESEADYFVNRLGIKCIIDFRSPSEYKRAKGVKLLDHYYPLYKVKMPFSLMYKPGDHVFCKEVKNKKLITNSTQSNMANGNAGPGTHDVYDRKHILIDFFRRNYIWAIYKSAPWYIKLYSLLFLLWDIIFITGFIQFVRVFARNVLNKKGVAGQYIDILSYSQGPICAGKI